MNREIKFRAWHTGANKMFSTEEMVADQLTLLPDGRFINVSGTSTRLSQIMDHMIPLQFTGLKDRNGKEIYEGDVVMWEDYQPENPDHWRYAEIFYNAPSLCYHLRIIKCKQLPPGKVFKNNFGNRHELKVIGNIFENPELLK